MHEQPTPDTDQGKIAKIIDKVEKMLRLAANAGTEEEATTAANMAQEYLAAYNLSLADVDINSDRGPKAEDVRVKETTKKVALYAWQKVLWEAISKSNYCWYRRVAEYHYNAKGHYVPRTFHHYIIGSQANVITTRLMGEYLEQTLSRLCPYKPGRDSSKSWNSWKEGCAARLAERLNEKLRQMMRETREKAEQAAASNTCTAISLVDVMVREDDMNYREEYGEEAYQRRLCFRNHADGEWVEGCENCENRKKWAEQDAERAAKLPPAKEETEAQKRKREDREARRSAKWWERYQQRQAREWAKKDQTAFKQGAEAGETIGLNAQVGTSEQKKIGGGQ